MKKFALVCFIFFVLSSAAFSQGNFTTDDPLPEFAIVVASSGINLRKAPNGKSQKIISLSAGTRVNLLRKQDKNETIEGITGKWLYVQRNNDEGWAFGGFLAPISSELPKNKNNSAETIQIGSYQVPKNLKNYKNKLYIGHKSLDVIDFENSTVRTLVSIDSIQKLFNEKFDLKRKEWENQPEKFVNTAQHLCIKDSDGTEHPISEEASKSMNEENNKSWARDYKPGETIDSIAYDESENRILFTHGNALMAVSGNGGPPQLLAFIPEKCISLPDLTMSPDGKKVACRMRLNSEIMPHVGLKVWILDLTTLQIERGPKMPEDWGESGRLSVPTNLIATESVKTPSQQSIQDVYRKNADNSLSRITDFRSLIAKELASQDFVGGEIGNLFWIVPGKRFIAAISTSCGDFYHGPVYSFDLFGKSKPKKFFDIAGFVNFPEISTLSKDYKWWAYIDCWCEKEDRPSGLNSGNFSGNLFLTDLNSINVSVREKVSAVAWQRPFLEKMN
ncbi:MAG: SH3 domain-containing protein [Candidatus Riflebacteria bacterium]|nr:SH3 domain-containing protein [Candidatus Riflebacteria bacterium]